MKLEWKAEPTSIGTAIESRTLEPLVCECDYHYARTVVDPVEANELFLGELVHEHVRMHNKAGCPRD